MARSSPQSFEKRQRERRKQLKREEKFERRLNRSWEKRQAKEEGTAKTAEEDKEGPEAPATEEG